MACLGAGSILLCVSERFSRTGQALQPRRGDGGTREVSAEALEQARRRDPGFLPRLALRATPWHKTDWPGLVDSLGRERDLAVFCDNSAFDDTAPVELWDVLLQEPERLVLTPRVMAELKPWLASHLDHPIVKALRTHHAGITQRLEPKPGDPGRKVFDYYMALLSARRNAIQVARSVFKRRHGRDPDLGEERRLADDIQKHVGQRQRLLATKAPGNFTDEALVYLAVEHALTTGKQTLIFTRDADVEEQFLKMTWLVNTHYRGMLLADYYIEHLGALRTYEFPAALLLDPNGPFEPRDALIIERDPDLNFVLPKLPHFVAISCINAGVHTSAIGFGAETEMARLLRVKDDTGGLNTDRLGGRNMHASIHPIPTGRGYDCAAIVFDRRKSVSSNGVMVSKVDVAKVMSETEQFAHMKPVKRSDLWVPPTRTRVVRK